MKQESIEDKRCESCRMFDHNACEYGGIDGFCCCADLDDGPSGKDIGEVNGE